MDKIVNSPNFNLNSSSLGSGLKSTLLFFWELIKIAAICLAIVLPVRYFLIEPFYVQGASMEPNFYNSDYLLIDKLSFRFREPARGDIVVFHNPRNESEYFIKRAIGLPGEKVIIRGGSIYIGKADEEHRLKESYISATLDTTGNIDTDLGANEYYLLGDNRPFSLDSRSFGPVSGEELVGRVWIRGWPPERLGVFAHISY